jgi:hypothetical protein
VPDHRGPRVLTYAGLLLGGIVLGAAGAAVVASRTQVRGWWVPWGLVLVLAAVLVCVRAAAWLMGSRGGAATVAVGWLLPTLAFSVATSGRDVVLPDGARSWIYLGVGLVGSLVAIAWPLPPGALSTRRTATDPVPESDEDGATVGPGSGDADVDGADPAGASDPA